MPDAFKELGLECSPVLEIEDLRAAFRAKGREEHPDGGGDSEGFSKLQEAMDLLSRPSSRLRHWLEIQGVEGSLRGALSSGLVDFFAKVGDGLQAADGVIREKESAGSRLGRALIEGRIQACREDLEELGSEISKEIDDRIGRFGEVVEGRADGWELVRELAFLEKWQAQVRERFARTW